jgi:hypothetical protein
MEKRDKKGKQLKAGKLAAAVALGRMGGRVKSEAKAAAARINGLLGGTNGQKPRDQWKPRGKNKTVKKPKMKLTVTTPSPPPQPILTALPVKPPPRVTQKLVRAHAPR